MDSNTDKPLLTNSYPTIAEESQHKLAPQLNNDSQPIVGSTNPYGNNQGYNQYPPQQGFPQPVYVNQGYNPVPYQPGPPQNPPYQPQAYPPTYNHQGFQPVVPGQFPPPPPPPPGQAFINLPSCIIPAHPKYRFILEQANLPCLACSSRGSDQVSMTPGCAAIGWSICLFIFTGICCFWIPFVVDGCKDIRISCNRCGHVKALIEKDCC